MRRKGRRAMGSPEIMAAWDEMCLKCVEYDAMVEQRDEARRINRERTAIWKAQERVMARMCEERDVALALAERRAGAINAFVAAVGHTIIMDGPVEAAWNALVAAAPPPDADPEAT
jgi:hypothetical protein